MANNLNDKYKTTVYAEKYAGLWAYGYQNGFSGTEGLYRCINELAYKCFNRDSVISILDTGCGVGRTATDIASFYQRADVIGIDNATEMLDIANKIITSKDELSIDLSNIGIGKITLTPNIVSNLSFINTDICSYLAGIPKVNLITAVNVIDRLENIEEFFKLVFQSLVTNGYFIFSSPLNFRHAEEWERYNAPEKLLLILKSIGFVVEEHFDNLPYKEILDGRGATEEYSVFVVKLKKAI